MLGFIIAVAAGAVTPMLEAPVASPVAHALRENIELGDGELRVLSFMIAMIGAAVLISVIGSGSSVTLAVGGAIGYFGPRLFGWLKRVIEGNRNKPGAE